MCGIAGEVRFGGELADVHAVARMAQAQQRRGPDGTGVLMRGSVAFAHRRLSILDTSQRAEQPMVDSELGLSLVFNGCIYNFRELREELTQAGYRFFSTSDSEVILKAWAKWGEACLQRFHGMFAFALHERESGRLVLVRDRLGIKPLYLSEQDAGKRLRFASTLPALLAGGDVDTALDPISLHHYLHLHAVVPAPRTILRGVRKLPPATLLEIAPDGRRSERRYWGLPQRASEDVQASEKSEQTWREEVRAALERAVVRRLVSDVPVGVLLSGGLDSSLIVALVAERHPHIETFSIGFESVGDELGDEFQYSDLIASRFGTRHHKLRIDSRSLLPELASCIEAMSEPMVSHDNIGFYLLSREVARHVKVVQTGQGADEIFAGYRWYPQLAELPAERGLRRAGGDEYARVFFDRDHAEYLRVVEPALHAEDHSLELARDFFDRPGTLVERALALDTSVMLVEDPVKRVDNMTMAWGLEARVPFLDHELVELAFKLPPQLKLAGGGKHILKEVAREVVPPQVIDRPKGYFPVPALTYLKGPYLALAREALTDRRARERGLFRPEYVEKLLSSETPQLTPLRGSKLWQLALLELWLRAHEL